MALSKRDRRLLATVAMAYTAFTVTGSIEGAADISFLSEEDRDRGSELLETASEAEVRAAVREVEKELACEDVAPVSSRAVLDVRRGS